METLPPHRQAAERYRQRDSARWFLKIFSPINFIFTFIPVIIVLTKSFCLVSVFWCIRLDRVQFDALAS